MAAFANISKQFEMYLLEACEPSKLSWGICTCLLKDFPSTGSVVCLLFDDNVYWGLVVLSAKRIYFCFVTCLLVQNETVKTWYNSLHYSATDVYLVTSLAISGSQYLVPKKCHWGFCWWHLQTAGKKSEVNLWKSYLEHFTVGELVHPFSEAAKWEHKIPLQW